MTSITKMFAGLAVLFAVCALVSGCQTTSAVSVAKTPEQRAYALYGTFVIMEEAAASLKQSPTTSDTVKTELKALDAKAKPAADLLHDAIEALLAAKSAVATGASTADKVVESTVALELVLTKVAPDIQKLIDAVGG